MIHVSLAKAILMQRLFRAILLATFLLNAAISHAIVRHDGVDDSIYISAATGFSDVVWIDTSTSGGSGVLIAPNWILTAAHVVDDVTAANLGSMRVGNGSQFGLGAFTADIAQVPILHPDWDRNFQTPNFKDKGNFLAGVDLALIKLDNPVPLPPRRRSSVSPWDFQVSPKVADIVGYGLTGTGWSGQTTDDGKKRAGTNLISMTSGNGRIVSTDFDSGTTLGSPPRYIHDQDSHPFPTARESSVGSGDSGGPWIVDGSVAAITSFGSSDAEYGTRSSATAVSPWNNWINNVMGGVNWITRGTSGFRTAANWGDGVIPTGQNVRFSLPAMTGSSTPTVTHTANNTVGTLAAEFGRTVLDMDNSAGGADWTFTATGPTDIHRGGQLVVRNGMFRVNANVELSNNGYLEIAETGHLDINRGETADSLYIGNLGQQNELQLRGGRIDVTGRTWLGYQPNSTGEFNLSSGQVAMLGNMIIGGDGAGTLRHSQTGGVATPLSVTGDLVLGLNQSGEGTYVKTSTGLALVVPSTTGGGVGRLIVGSSGKGTFENRAGTTRAERIEIGVLAPSRDNSLTVDGGLVESKTAAVVGFYGAGQLNVNAGQFRTTGGSIILGAGDSQAGRGEGSLNVSGGSVAASQSIVVGQYGTGTLNVTAGEVVAQSLVIGSLAGGSGAVNLSGGVLNIGQGPISFGVGTGEFNFTGGTLRVGTYYGSLHNDGGILEHNNWDSQTAITGNYEQEPSAAMQFSLGSSTSNPLRIHGEAILDGVIDVSLANGFDPTGLAFHILNSANQLSGTLADLAFAGARIDVSDALGSFQLTAAADSVNGGYSLWLDDFQAAPPILPGDFDFDGTVDGTDFLKWQRGESLNRLSAADLADWKAHFGQTAGIPASGAVPEPATWGLAVACLAAVTVGSRRRHFRQNRTCQ